MRKFSLLPSTEALTQETIDDKILKLMFISLSKQEKFWESFKIAQGTHWAFITFPFVVLLILFLSLSV